MKSGLATTCKPGDTIEVAGVTITILQKTGKQYVKLLIEAPRELSIQIKRAKNAQLP